MPPQLGFLISHDKSLLGPLSTTLGLQDMYDLIEVIMVDRYNDWVLAKRRERE